MGLAIAGDMLSTALRNKHDGQSSRSARSTARSRARAAEMPTQHLKAVASDPEAAEAADATGLGDVAGLPLGRMPDGDDEPTAGAPQAEASGEPADAAAETGTPTVEP